MKKILTLLIAFGAFISLHAQTTRDEARRVILGQPKSGNYPSDSRDVILGGNNYPNGNYPNGSREAQIDQINREYDYKIQSVRNNPYISNAEKDRQIRNLERQRENKIRKVNEQYNGNYDRNRNYDRNGNYGKKNNGKHLGWEKGVGNPHRNGGKPGKGNKGHDRDDEDDD
ncbi:MAG: hypothetical protein ACM3VS_07100 [Candidatus Dadabacteria bacterium]